MDLETKTILLADDEEEIREDLALFLEYEAFKVIQVKDGKEAYQAYLDNTFDLIITDIEMPRMNGLEFVEQVRKDDKTLPILIISGYSDKDKLLRAIKLNLLDYVIKPFTRDGMLKMINNIFIEAKKQKVQEEDKIYSLKHYYFDFSSRMLIRDKEEYVLSKKQAETLKLLFEKPNIILSPVDIYYSIYPTYKQEYSNASIRNIIKRLRTIFPKDVIESVYGEGYRFNIDKLS